MTTRRHSLRRVSAAASLVLICAGYGTGALAVGRPEFEQATTAILSDLAVLRTTWHREFGRAVRATGAPLALRLSCPGAVNGETLDIEIVRVGPRWCFGQAWCPKWNRAHHTVDASRLAFTGTPEKGELAGNVVLALVSDGHRPPPGEPVICNIRIEARLRVSEVKGRFSLIPEVEEAAVPRRSGSVTGRLSPGIEDLAKPSALPAPRLELSDGYGLYAIGVQAEQEAARRYRDVRAFAMCVGHGIPLAEALESALRVEPVRPAFLAPKESDRKAAPPALAMDDDLGLDLGDGDLGEAKPARDTALGTGLADVSRDPKAKERLEALREARRSVRRLRAAVERYAAAGSAALPRPVDVADPTFGPWFGTEPLPSEPDAPNRLPAAAGAQGTQAWRAIDGWRVIGPFPAVGHSYANPNLPEMFGAGDTAYRPDLEALRTRGYGNREPLQWASARHSTSTSWFLYPPGWTGKEYGDPAQGAGLPDGGFFASAELTAPEPMTVWLALGVDDFGLAWLNERLICVWPARKQWGRMEEVAFMRAPLRKGRNELVLRIDNQQRTTGFWACVCTRGAPRPASEAEAADQRVRTRASKLRALPTNVSGWRHDSSGCFPASQPVTAWDLDTSRNVLWRDLGLGGQSTAVMVGDRLFLNVHPRLLVCLNRLNGEILWSSVTLSRAEREEHTPGHWQKLWRADLEWRRLGGSGDAVLEQKSKEWRELCNSVGRTGSHGAWWTDNSFPAPVTDGEHVWVKHGVNAWACYELDGTCRWSHIDSFEGDSNTICTSPVLVDGTLMIERTPRPVRKGDVKPPAELCGYDALSGDRRWTAQVSNPASSGTPVPMRLTDGETDMAVVVTGGGTVVRVEDGRVLVPRLLADSSSGSPSAHGDVVFLARSALRTAVRLIMVDRDTVGGRRLWAWDDSPEFHGGLVLAGGMLHGLGGGEWTKGFHLFDAITGERPVRYANAGIVLGDSGRPYVPPSFAGGYLFLGTDGRKFRGNYAHAALSVRQAGPGGRVVARNKLRLPYYANPCFDGERTYIRTFQSLFCVGYTGEEGRAYEAVVNARAVLPDLGPVRPPDREPVSVRPVDDARNMGPRIPFHYETLMGYWRFLGPMPLENAEAGLAAFAGADKKGGVHGGRLVVGGKEFRTRFFDRHGQHYYVAVVDGRRVVALLKATERAPNSVSFWSKVLVNRRERVVRVIHPTPGVDVWLGGVRIRHHDRLALAPGDYPICLQVKVRDVPEQGLMLPLRFAPSDDLALEQRQWRESIEYNRPILERIIKHQPDGELADRARQLIARLEK